jgi:hypothetical protein
MELPPELSELKGKILIMLSDSYHLEYYEEQLDVMLEALANGTTT